jgi:hypothetical protein
MNGTGACTCEAGTFGATCAGTCDCGTGTCDDGAAGTGTCTCEAGTYGSTCAGVCDCGIIGCDDGAAGTGACLCPNAPATTFTIAYPESWGSGVGDSTLAWTELTTNWQTYGPCEPLFVEVGQPFDLAALQATNADVVLVSNPGGGGIQYSAAETTAIRDYVTGHPAGAVISYLLFFNDVNNSALADLGGIDSASLTQSSIASSIAVDVIDANHPILTGLPATFDLIPGWAFVQLDNLGVHLTANAAVIAEATDDTAAIVALESTGVRGVTFNGFPEYQSGTESHQAMYNALLWAAQVE